MSGRPGVFFENKRYANNLLGASGDNTSLQPHQRHQLLHVGVRVTGKPV